MKGFAFGVINIDERRKRLCVHFGITKTKGVKFHPQIRNVIKPKESKRLIAVVAITRIALIMKRINVAIIKSTVNKHGVFIGFVHLLICVAE